MNDPEIHTNMECTHISTPLTLNKDYIYDVTVNNYDNTQLHDIENMYFSAEVDIIYYVLNI